MARRFSIHFIWVHPGGYTSSDQKSYGFFILFFYLNFIFLFLLYSIFVLYSIENTILYSVSNFFFKFLLIFNINQFY